MPSRSRAARGARAAAASEPTQEPNPPGVIDSLLSGWWGAASSEPESLKPRARPTSYNERTLLETERPVYRDWKGDAGQDPMMSDVEYRTRLESEPQEPAPAEIKNGSTTGYHCWSQEELDLLTQLVEKDGYRDWEAKAKRLGTGRTGQAVRTRFERYSRSLQAGNTQPTRPARARSPAQAPPRRATEPQLPPPNSGGRTRRTVDAQWRQSLSAGDLVDARDGRNNWYESKIVAVKNDKVKIHFLGWSKKWDEWVDRGFDGIQPLGTRQTVNDGKSSDRAVHDSPVDAATSSAEEQHSGARKLKGTPAPDIVPSVATPGFIKGGLLAVGQLVKTQEGAQGRIKGGRAGFVIVEVSKGEVLYKRASELTPVENDHLARAPTATAKQTESPAVVRRAGSTKSRKRKTVEQPASGQLQPGSQAGTYQSWSQEELDTLVELVEKEGFGDWETKSLFLGSGRTGQAVRTRYERHMRMLESSASGGGRTSPRDVPTAEDDAVVESEDEEESEAEEQTLVQRAWSRVTSAFTGSPMVKRQKTKHHVDALELTEPAQRGHPSPRVGVVTGATRSSARRSSSSGSTPRSLNEEATGSASASLQEEPKSSASASLQEEPKCIASSSGSIVYDGQTREERDRFWDRQRLNRCQLACRERNLWPGGDKTNLRHRLVKFEFEPDALSDLDRHGPDETQLLSSDPHVSAGPATAASTGRRKTAKANFKDRIKDKRKAAKTPALPLGLLIGPGSCTIGGAASSASKNLRELVSRYTGSFLENIAAFVEQYGVEIVLPSIEARLEDVLEEDYPGHNFSRAWRVEVDGGPAPRQKFTLRIYENDARRGCEHCTCSGWGERPMTAVTYHFVVISEPKQLDKPVLSLHGMLHANGYGHLLHVNGKEVGSFQTGGLLMDAWDGMCIALGACQVSLQDKSMKSGLHLRVIHAVAYNHSWYGRWGYKFERGSYGNDQGDYNEALEALQSVSLDSVRGDCTENSGLVAVINRYAAVDDPQPKTAAAAAVQATDLQTIQDLFRHMLELLRSKHRAINRHQVVYDLTTFTRGILFGEAFHVEDGDGRKMSVKRAKQIRRCAQVLLDCRWFAKRFTEQRIELQDEEEHVRVVSTLAAHLKLQVACETEQPQIHLSLPASTTVGELKDLSVDRFREAYPPLANFNGRSIRLRGTSKALDEGQTVADVAAAHASNHADEPLVYESIGNGVDSKQITPKDTAIVKCVCGTVTDDGERMVACDKCGNWLHTRCIGLADGKDIPSDFSLTKHLRIKCCKHIRPASIDEMPKIYYWGMGSPRQNIGGLAERGLVDASTSPRSSYTGGRRGGTGNRAARAAGN